MGCKREYSKDMELVWKVLKKVKYPKEQGRAFKGFKFKVYLGYTLSIKYA